MKIELVVGAKKVYLWWSARCHAINVAIPAVYALVPVRYKTPEMDEWVLTLVAIIAITGIILRVIKQPELEPCDPAAPNSSST